MTRTKVQRDEHDCDVHSENGIDVIPLPRDKAGTPIHIGDFVAVLGSDYKCVAVCQVRGLTAEEIIERPVPMEPVSERELQWRFQFESGYTCLAKNTFKVLGEEELVKWLIDWETNAKESATIDWHYFDGILNDIKMTNAFRREATGHWDDVE